MILPFISPHGSFQNGTVLQHVNHSSPGWKRREIYSHLDITPGDKTSALVSKVHAVQHESVFSPAQKFHSAHGPNLPEGSADTGVPCRTALHRSDTSGTSCTPVKVSTHLIRALLNISAKTTLQFYPLRKVLVLSPAKSSPLRSQIQSHGLPSE